jgi:hypothetical protein
VLLALLLTAAQESPGLLAPLPPLLCLSLLLFLLLLRLVCQLHLPTHVLKVQRQKGMQELLPLGSLLVVVLQVLLLLAPAQLLLCQEQG